MITIEEVKKELSILKDALQKAQKNSMEPKKAGKKLDAKIRELTHIKRYLESEPRPEFITSEIKRLRDLLGVLSGRFEHACKNATKPGQELPDYTRRAMLREHNKLYEVTKLKTQLKTLNFIKNG